MYIKRLTLENFRGFDSFSIEFGSNYTILIGKNGSDKSNVLDGWVYALSFPLLKLKKMALCFQWLILIPSNLPSVLLVRRMVVTDRSYN